MSEHYGSLWHPHKKYVGIAQVLIKPPLTPVPLLSTVAGYGIFERHRNAPMTYVLLWMIVTFFSVFLCSISTLNVPFQYYGLIAMALPLLYSYYRVHRIVSQVRFDIC